MARGAKEAVPPPDIVHEWLSPVVAEVIGTFALVFAGAGAIIQTGGNNLVAIALAHGLAIGLLVAAAGHISGGLFNPAVAIGLAIGRVITPRKVAVFIVAQQTGATLAALALKAVFPDQLSNPVHLGTPGVGSVLLPAGGTLTFSIGRAFVSEVILSFFLMYVIYGVAVDKRGPATIAGLAIGLTITIDIFANGVVGGAAMNPARHFGPALISATWDNWWIYYTAPPIGMAIAAIVYAYIHMADQGHMADRRAA